MWTFWTKIALKCSSYPALSEWVTRSFLQSTVIGISPASVSDLLGQWQHDPSCDPSNPAPEWKPRRCGSSKVTASARCATGHVSVHGLDHVAAGSLIGSSQGGPRSFSGGCNGCSLCECLRMSLISSWPHSYMPPIFRVLIQRGELLARCIIIIHHVGQYVVTHIFIDGMVRPCKSSSSSATSKKCCHLTVNPGSVHLPP